MHLSKFPNDDARAGGLDGLKVGFLYNHDALHQISHTAPMISRLRKLCPNIRVDVLTANEAQADAVMRQLDTQLPLPEFVALQPHRILQAVQKITGGVVPLGRVGHLAANLELLRSYDALIVPETTSTLLKTRFGLTKTRLIFYPHGAGDRSISVSPEMAHFDFVLLPGEKTRERMLAQGAVRAADHAVVGYPKFDSLLDHHPKSLFSNDGPIVLYNPHFDPKLSSWYDFGLPVLEYFANQGRFNLIVAPHVMLFKRKVLASLEHHKFRVRRAIPRRFFDCDHIHIDQGGPNCVDMTYTRMADIYLGDVSSQIYEFIERPRPAIFLNSHGADWQGDPNYAFWNFGPVVDDIGDLGRVIDSAVPLTSRFEERQSEAFRQTFDIDPTTSAACRAAAAIAKFLQREFPESRSNG